MSHFKVQTIAQDEFIDLRLYQAGVEDCQASHLYGPAVRKHFLFHYILSGKGSLQSTDSQGEDHVYQLSSGQGFLISPNQVNTYLADNQDPWKYMWIEIDGLFAKRAFSLAGLSFNSPVYTAQDNQSRKLIASEMMQLTNHLDHSSLFLSGHLFLILDALIASSETKEHAMTNRRTDFYIEEAKAFIRSHYQNNISVEDVANHCRLNRNYLGRIFKETTSVGVQDFLIDYRLSIACDLLKFSDDSIRTVSEKIGYNNQLYFSKAFKLKFGVSPTEWRTSNRYYHFK